MVRVGIVGLGLLLLWCVAAGAETTAERYMPLEVPPPAAVPAYVPFPTLPRRRWMRSTTASGWRSRWRARRGRRRASCGSTGWRTSARINSRGEDSGAGDADQERRLQHGGAGREAHPRIHALSQRLCAENDGVERGSAAGGFRPAGGIADRGACGGIEYHHQYECLLRRAPLGR